MKRYREISLEVSGLRVREAEGEEGSRVIEGHAVVFGQRSVNLVPWSSYREVYEVMEPGSITSELLNRSDVVLTAYHDNGRILGRSTNGAGTLQLSMDSKGVFIRCELPHTANGDEMLELIKRGDVRGMSFAYSTDEADSENCVSYEKIAERGANGKDVFLRHVKKVTGLYDVTIAGHPAYQGTDVSAAKREAIDRELDEVLGKEPDTEGNHGTERRDTEETEAKKREQIAEQVAELRRAAKF